jgi:hypothetical protein
MKKVKTHVEKVIQVESENDMDSLENFDKLILLIVDEENKQIADMFASLSYNYLDLGFSFMLRNESTKELEKQLNLQYDLGDDVSGGIGLSFLLLIYRSYYQSQFRR